MPVDAICLITHHYIINAHDDVINDVAQLEVRTVNGIRQENAFIYMHGQYNPSPDDHRKMCGNRWSNG